LQCGRTVSRNLSCFGHSVTIHGPTWDDTKPRRTGQPQVKTVPAIESGERCASP
jgi:hypothetical protein